MDLFGPFIWKDDGCLSKKAARGQCSEKLTLISWIVDLQEIILSLAHNPTSHANEKISNMPKLKYWDVCSPSPSTVYR